MSVVKIPTVLRPQVGGNKETKEVVSFGIGQKKALLTTECRALLRL